MSARKKTVAGVIRDGLIARSTSSRVGLLPEGSRI
jgi:hypothetical protein